MAFMRGCSILRRDTIEPCKSEILWLAAADWQFNAADWGFSYHAGHTDEIALSLGKIAVGDVDGDALLALGLQAVDQPGTSKNRE
jgi:hypothetical protein